MEANAAGATAQGVIAAMITPALLILASGSLIATALVRLARVVDRIRHFAADGPPAPDELTRYERRALLAERAVLAFFLAVVATVLAGASIALDRTLGAGIGWLPIGLTVIGMALIVTGASAMVAETRLATTQINEEISALRRRANP